MKSKGLLGGKYSPTGGNDGSEKQEKRMRPLGEDDISSL